MANWEIFKQRFNGVAANRNCTFCAPFPQSCKETHLKVEICHIYFDEFGHPQARGIEHLKHGFITNSYRVIYVRTVQEFFYFFLNKEFRQRLPGFRGLQIYARITLYDAV